MANMLVRPSKLSKILIIMTGWYSINWNATIFYSHWLRRSLEDKSGGPDKVQTGPDKVQTKVQTKLNPKNVCGEFRNADFSRKSDC